jgi:hypothetical protein
MDEPSKKLRLSKETLRTLDDDDLTDVVGGASGICVNSVVCHSGVCDSVVCQSAVCHSGALCQSVIC